MHVKNNFDLKKQMDQKIYMIAKYRSLKIIHYVSIAYLSLAFLYQGMIFHTSETAYTLTLVVIMPLLIQYFLRDKEHPEQPSLPLLSKKYRYSEPSAKILIYSFTAESLILVIWQFGNFLYPYENIYIQFSPLFLFFGRFIAYWFFIVLFRFYLSYQLRNNLL